MACYIIQVVGTEMVKIGWADDVETRHAQLQCANYQELRVIRLIDGPRSTERSFHQKFGEHRERGEWFRLHPDMLTYLPVEASKRPDVQGVIEAFGDHHTFKTLLGVSASMVNAWEHAGIPDKRWPQITAIASRLGITVARPAAA